MKGLGHSLKTKRLEGQLSQQELANRAKVSLATIQNIEAGRANPSLNTLSAICQSLGLEIAVADAQGDERDLISLGVPLLDLRSRSVIKGSPERLLTTLTRNRLWIQRLQDGSREEKAVASFLWAIKDHYPSLWLELDAPIRSWFEQRKPSSLSIKLRRISLNQISEYL